MKFIRTWRFITLMLAAFSLSLSMTHLLELPQRMRFDQQLWVRVTVNAVIKIMGLSSLAISVLVETPYKLDRHI